MDARFAVGFAYYLGGGERCALEVFVDEDVVNVFPAPLPAGLGRTADILGRVGAASRGVLYVVIGTLALLAAGDVGRARGPKEALVSLLAYSWGRPLVFLLACGFAAFAVFHGLVALLNLKAPATRWAKMFHRVVALCLAGTYGSLTYFAVRLALYRVRPDSGDIHEDVAVLLAFPLGRVVVMGIAAGVAGFGGYELYRACHPRPDPRLETDQRATLKAIARIGIAGRGILFLGIAGLLARVGFDNDAKHAGGMGMTLRTLQSHAYAKPILLTVGLSLVAFGVMDIFAPHPPRGR